MTDSEHILIEDQHGRPRPVCGERAQYQRDPITMKWANPCTGGPAPFLGEEWDIPVGDLCPNCLVLVLTLGDDPCELTFWQQPDPGRPTPLEIAETALRDIEIDAEPPAPPRPIPAAPTTKPRQPKGNPRQQQERNQNNKKKHRQRKTARN